LTDNELPEGHSLFNIILSKENIEGKDLSEDSELKYLQEIRKIRDGDSDLFQYIKKLPKKSRVARKQDTLKSDSVLTYFRKGKVQKFFIVSSENNKEPLELDFIQTAKKMSAKKEEKELVIDDYFYELLEKNLLYIHNPEAKEEKENVARRGLDNSLKIVKILNSKNIKNYQGYTDEDEYYLKKVIKEFENSSIPKKISQIIFKKIQETPEIIQNPLKLITILKKNIPSDFLEDYSYQDQNKNFKKEVILSEYFKK